MYLFFDTETTGLPKDWNAPITELNNWPRLVQIAWLIYDKSEKKVFCRNYIIKPEGFTIPSYASRIHNITTEKALNEGRLLQWVLTEFSEAIEKADFLIAHNMSFDEKIISAEFIRKKIPNSLSEKTKICTMETAVNFCKIPGDLGYKWPSLGELYFKLFNETLKEIHGASVDVRACAACFFKLKQLRIIEIKHNQ
jgi:DNA polymerase-3 subunit epsilon